MFNTRHLFCLLLAACSFLKCEGAIYRESKVNQPPGLHKRGIEETRTVRDERTAIPVWFYSRNRKDERRFGVPQQDGKSNIPVALYGGYDTRARVQSGLNKRASRLPADSSLPVSLFKHMEDGGGGRGGRAIAFRNYQPGLHGDSRRTIPRPPPKYMRMPNDLANVQDPGIPKDDFQPGIPKDQRPGIPKRESRRF